MSGSATATDIANVIKLLERLRTGEMNLIPSLLRVSEAKQDASTDLLQRVEAVLSDHLRRLQEPVGDGRPAFPIVGDQPAVLETGMTLRDYFAAKAMPVLLDLVPTEVWNQGQGMDGKIDNALMAAKAAYRMAEAMLKARSA